MKAGNSTFRGTLDSTHTYESRALPPPPTDPNLCWYRRVDAHPKHAHRPTVHPRLPAILRSTPVPARLGGRPMDPTRASLPRETSFWGPPEPKVGGDHSHSESSSSPNSQLKNHTSLGSSLVPPCRIHPIPLASHPGFFPSLDPKDRRTHTQSQRVPTEMNRYRCAWRTPLPEPTKNTQVDENVQQRFCCDCLGIFRGPLVCRCMSLGP